MRVTYVLNSSGKLWSGGGTIQAERTDAAVTALGVEVDYFTPLTDRLGDLVHFFGSEVEFRHIARYCWAHGVPYVVSPMFYLGRSPARVFEWMVRARMKKSRPWHLRQVMARAQAVLPNSSLEIGHLRRVMAVPAERIRLIPHGVEDRFSQGDAQLFREHFGIREPFVLNVGRIEPLKNQLRLIRALRGKRMKLAIIGAPSNPGYAERCRAEGGEDVLFVGQLAHDSPLLPAAYAACRVFALPSWVESVGLTAMEAAAAGAPVAMTCFGGAREYLGEWARYAHPAREEEIGSAVEALWGEHPQRRTARMAFMADRFSWQAAGRLTVAEYFRALALPEGDPPGPRETGSGGAQPLSHGPGGAGRPGA